MTKRPSFYSVSSSDSGKSGKSSLYPPSVLSASSGWEADIEDSKSMSNDDFVPTRPLSVAIPKGSAVHGPYCPRRPNLREILANTSDPPWTLAAFMAYLSNNHCLENLEFTMDAGRYKKHYAKMMSRAGPDGQPPVKDSDYVKALWSRLVDAYIRPNGSREVNLPSNVRDPLLELQPEGLPPKPETLDLAVTKIYELMEDSVLVPFLNSVYPQTAHPTISSCPINASDESLSKTYEDRSSFARRSRHARHSPPPQTAVEPHANSYSPPSMMNRKSASSGYAHSKHARFSTKLSNSTSAPEATSSSDKAGSAAGGTPAMTDDGGSTDSPSNDSPTTPPASPPMSDANAHKRDSGMWRKLGRLSKVGKKKSEGGLKEEQ